MAASDSEDFESADEDIETNTASSTSVKKTTEHSNTLNESNESSIGNTKGKPLSNKNVKTKNPDDEKNNTTDKNLEENNIPDKSSNKSIKESKINKQIKKDNVRKSSSSSNNEEKTQSSGVKRLGSKLGSKVTNNIVKQDKNNDSISISNKTVNNETDSSMNNEISKQIDNTKLELKQENTNKRSENESLVSKNVDNDFSNDGWDLEDGFDDDVHSDIQSKPKDEEFEKELFPVLNKLSNLSSGASNNEKISESGNRGGQNGVGGVTSNWGNWGGWGVSSLLSTATESVSTLTSHVSAGFNTVLESGLGAPDPELLAQALEKERLEKEKQKVVEEQIAEEPSSVGGGVGVTSIGGGFSQLMSGVSQLSNKVISGGLDTLETLGKKTMEVLQDGDPGLRKKRALFFQDDDKPVLSQILREAKEVAEKSDKLEEEKQAARKVHFETLFDDYHGLVHLEALEMLSKQCQLKIHTILLGMSGDGLKDLRETLDQVKELCELSDEEDEENDKEEENSDADFAKKVSDAIQMMAVQVPHTKLIDVSEAVTNWLNSESAKNSTPSEIHQKAVSSMAEFTSVSMETFHRMAELLLIKQHHSTADEAESLTQLTGTLCARVSRMASKFTVLLSESDDTKSNNGIITTIFMESANSSSYIQDACRLIVPVLQVGAAS